MVIKCSKPAARKFLWVPPLMLVGGLAQNDKYKTHVALYLERTVWPSSATGLHPAGQPQSSAAALFRGTTRWGHYCCFQDRLWTLHPERSLIPAWCHWMHYKHHCYYPALQDFCISQFIRLRMRIASNCWHRSTSDSCFLGRTSCYSVCFVLRIVFCSKNHRFIEIFSDD